LFCDQSGSAHKSAPGRTCKRASNADSPHSVEKDGPAYRAGQRSGDRIVRFDGLAVNGIDDLHRALTGERIGAASRLAFVRGTELLEIEVRPVEFGLR
jgi:S1-C subfamily serine protease